LCGGRRPIPDFGPSVIANALRGRLLRAEVERNGDPFVHLFHSPQSIVLPRNHEKFLSRKGNEKLHWTEAFFEAYGLPGANFVVSCRSLGRCHAQSCATRRILPAGHGKVPYCFPSPLPLGVLLTAGSGPLGVINTFRQSASPSTANDLHLFVARELSGYRRRGRAGQSVRAHTPPNGWGSGLRRDAEL